MAIPIVHRAAKTAEPIEMPFGKPSRVDARNHVLDGVQMAGWLEFNVPFQHKYGYIRDERSGMQIYPFTQ